MADPLLTYPVLCASAMLGGAVNAVAGGGTLLTFPALLAVLTPVQANATSTLALVPGSMAGAWAYRTEIDDTRPVLARLFVPSFLGGIAGALAVTRFPERVFEQLVPWLLLIASVLFLLQPTLSRWLGAHPHQAPHGRTVAGVVMFQFLVGVYGGYFGAGIGILMLSALGFMGIGSIHRLNGVKTLLATAINGITAVIFVIEGVVVWRYAAAMAVSSIVGGYLGARFAKQMPAAWVRTIVTFIGFGVAAFAFYKRFAR